MRILRPRVSACSLPTRPRRLLFLALAAAVAIMPAFEAARIATAVTLGTSLDLATLQRALAMDPGNAEIEHRLGLLLFYSDSSPDRSRGLDHMRRAAELDADEALYWSDLAAACESSHDVSCADGATARALDASPMTPRLYWSAGNYHLRAGWRADALANFRRLLDLDPSYADAVFQVCLRASGSSDSIRQGILATNRNPQVSITFVNLASGLGDDDSAYTEWRHFASADYADGAYEAGNAHHVPMSLTEVEPYLDHLIADGKERDAVAVWTDLQRLSVVPASGSDFHTGKLPADDALQSQPVFNGGFERSPLNAGFDWRYNSQPFVSVALADASHSGSHSLRVEFTGNLNQEYEPIFEVVPMEPGRSYALSAFVRSQAIASDTGPRLRVRDLGCSSASCLDISTPDVTSTTPWHEVNVSFTAGPETRFVRLSIWRPRSRGYPSEISGVLWVDDVSIIERPPQPSLSVP